MSLVLFVVLLVAPLTICIDIQTQQLDYSLLQNVFGTPPPLAQAQVVAPENATLLDLDYWDSEDFKPSPLNYDMFDWTLTKRVAALSNNNFLLSPLCLKLALAILTEAATGATQAELVSVLGFERDRSKVRGKFATILGSLQTKSSDYILDMGSRIYVESSSEPRQMFSAIAQEFYKTELVKADFSNPKVAASQVNAWVANITKGRIPELVTDADVAGVVVMILNTLFFKGTWRHQFPPNATKAAPFYVSPSVQKMTDFMNVQNRFYFTESMKYDAKILRMPYLGKKFAMYIVVPNSLTGLPRVLNGINEIRQELVYMSEREVDVTIPKFQFDYTSHLSGVLREMGIRQTFEDTASFPGIQRGQSLYQRLRVSKVLQKAGIEVNELGSIAYSATDISLVNKFGEDSDNVPEIVANKPFLFFIEDQATRQLLFTGRLADPSQAKTFFKL